MCEQCSAGCKTYNKKIFDKYFLVVATKDGDVMEKGDYGLVVCNDPEFLFENIIEIVDTRGNPGLECGRLEDCDDWFRDVFCIYPERDNNFNTMVSWANFYNAYTSAYSEEKNWFNISLNLLKEIHEAIDSGFMPEDEEDE